MNELKYTGVYIQELTSTDFIAGSTSPIKLEPRNTTLKWKRFFSAPERQVALFGETNGCVSFSCVHHAVATQLNWMLDNKLFDQVALDFFISKGYVVNGRFNLSERFIVVLSNTDPEKGNSWQNVAQAVRRSGIVPESVCPHIGPKNVGEYYDVSDEAIALGAESLKYLNFAWQAIMKKDIRQYLIQAPEVIFTAVCPGWSSDKPVKACNQPIQHATGVYEVQSDGVICIYDQYEPFEKFLASDYGIPYVFQIIVTPIPHHGPTIENHLFLRDMNVGERSEEVLYLQARLDIPKTGIYDDLTRAAVFTYQLNNKVASLWDLIWLRGRRVGKKTRESLNK